MKTYKDMISLFEQANKDFLAANQDLLATQVSERTLCGALMLHIYKIISKSNLFNGYFVDVEYNRNKGALKTICKTIRGMDTKIIRITCDLILHSRGQNPEQDNLIAIEMKKSSARSKNKNSDRERLMALTKDSFNDIWSYDGRSLPECVCRYVLGVYYEINFSKHDILIEYYRQGTCTDIYHINFLDIKNITC